MIRAFPGQPSPLGFSVQGNRANFALFSSHAEKVILGLFSPGKRDPDQEFPASRTGNIWHLALENLLPGALYGFRVEGPQIPHKGLLFHPLLWHADPYTKILDSPPKWGTREKRFLSSASLPPPFDWQGVEPPRIPLQDLVIYEMHIRGFTQHPSSGAKAPGTYLGVIEKIPYLKKLGVNAVELMPIHEFDEVRSKDIQPQTGEPLPNYWGYNTLFFFAPMRRYAQTNNPINEFKTMVRELHRNGIEVILDVVYNHTGEGKETDYDVNFRGIDNPVYYMVDEEGRYRDYSGCGNTFNCNHPIVHSLIVDSLRYWSEEMRVDGFRFDLASILTRDEHGAPMAMPPVIREISSMQGVKLIAEAWDAAGLYQVGLFPKWGPWSDWNGRYRDTVRRFIKGTDGQAGAFADALAGSESVFGQGGSPLSSINFITAHDGYSLRDLVTYQMKHNYENGEMNRDGANQNDNWNCGAEGPTQDPKIAALRERQMRNFLLALFLSQGIPMILMGDEYGHTRRGNNNPYVQDNDLNWHNWGLVEKNGKIFEFLSSLITFRKAHPNLRHSRYLAKSDIDWHGFTPNHPDWSDHSRLVAFSLKGESPIYAAINANFHHAHISLPADHKWRAVVLTEQEWDHQHFDGRGPLLPDKLDLAPYSAILAIGVK